MVLLGCGTDTELQNNVGMVVQPRIPATLRRRIENLCLKTRTEYRVHELNVLVYRAWLWGRNKFLYAYVQ